MSECTCVGCRKNPSLPSNNSKSRKALENNNNFEPIKADGFQDTTVNVGKCGPSWAPVAASPFRHGAFRPSNLQWIFIFHNPGVPNDDSFRPSICPMPMWCPPVLTWWYGRGNLRVHGSLMLGSLSGSMMMNGPRSGPATLREWLRKKSARHNKKLHNRQQLQLLKKVHPV